MIMLDPDKGTKAPEHRLVVYCDPYNGLLYDLPITTLVVLQTMQHLEAMGLDPENPDNVSEHSGEVAELLVLEGWFTDEEYAMNVAREEAEDIEDELKDLLGGE